MINKPSADIPLSFKTAATCPALNTHIIAEIGINHNGSIETALELINAAKKAGCNSVKFQKRNPDKAVPDHQKDIIRETPW